MDIDEIRRLIIISICSDDHLLDTLVLKGGNALSLIHGVGNRTSIDIDFSIGADFSNLDDVKNRLFSSLRERFDTKGYVIFDEDLRSKPSKIDYPFWGGYLAEFKLISRKRYIELQGDLAATRRQAELVGDAKHTRKFRIEISKYEYVDNKEEAEIEDYLCYVYTLEMIAVEKLRAICQQMEGYTLTKHPRPRARDFYDIFSIINERGVNFSNPDFYELVKNIFEAKEVPIHFLTRISEEKEFHRQDWPSVRDSIQGEKRNFDFYFDFVVRQVKKLKPFWEK